METKSNSNKKHPVKKLRKLKQLLAGSIEVLKKNSPEIAEKINLILDRIQAELDKKEDVVEATVNHIQDQIDVLIGEKIEKIIENSENKIDEKGGQQLNDHFNDTLNKIESVVAPIFDETKKKIKENTKDFISKAKEIDFYKTIKKTLKKIED